LAENGGKIRATNGNNSYGLYGSVSEGMDVSEVPITATVDNRSTDATVGYVFTDGSRILTLEYSNAGRNYSNATVDVIGDGFGDSLTPTYKNGAVYEIRLLETVTSPESNFGGDDYVSVSNVAQSGDYKQITISNTDVNNSSGLIGMAVYVTEGLGAGQYGYIVSYNAGSKLAKIARDSFITLTVTAATASNNRFTVADNSTLYVGQPIMFSGTTVGGVNVSTTNVTVYYVTAIYGGTQFTISTAQGGPEFDVTADDTGSMTLHEAGFDHLTPTTCTNTEFSTDLITVASTANLVANMQVRFTGTTFGNITNNINYYVLASGLTATKFKVSASLAGPPVTLSTASGSMTVIPSETVLDGTTVYSVEPRIIVSAPPSGTRARARAVVTTGKVSSIRISEPGSGYVTAPTITIVDPNNTVEAPYETFIGNGVLGQPTWTNRGSAWATASCLITEIGLAKTVTNITQGSPAVVTTSTNHTYSDSTKVAFSGIGGMIELNTGVYYYTKSTGLQTFEIYVDEALTSPLDTNDFNLFIGSGTPTVTAFGGYRDSKQNGKFIKVEGLSDIPQPGANVQFSHLPTTYYKLVSVQSLLGTQYPYTALLQLSPEVSVSDAADHGVDVEIKIRYSQVRLTGHDFLDIGTGGKATTNYPGLPTQEPDSDNETVESGGGRVFFTSTDQDGNFRVGDLFSVEQATGIATLNADAFNISGLQELQLGDLTLGGTSASINEFSTDGTMAANSDQIVPTQRAIRTYIASQIGGGASTLNVNLITAGLVQISGNTITTTTGVGITISAVVNFTGGISGAPVAMSYFVQS
jgi:hypothetical protein